MYAKPCILLVGHSSGGHLFGAELSFLDNLKTLVSLGNRVTVVLPTAENRIYLDKISSYTREIHIVPIRWNRGSESPDEKVIQEIADIATNTQAQLIISNTVTMREPLIAARRLGIPAVCSVREVPTSGDKLTKRLGKEPDQIIQEIHEQSDYVIANSIYTLNRYYLDGRSAVVRNTFDEGLLNIERSQCQKIRVGFVGSDSSEKGIDDYVRLASNLRESEDFEFYVFGCDSASSLTLEPRNSLPNLKFMGYTANSVDIYQQVDVVVQLSILEETFSRVTLEAMASGALIIAYNVGAISELIEHEITGYLLTAGAIHEVEKLLLEILRKPKSAIKIAKHGQQFARTNYSSESQRADFRSVLGVLLPDSNRKTQSRDDLNIPLPVDNRSEYADPFLVGNRARLGTATCVRFTDTGQLVAASLIGKKLHLFEFDYYQCTSKAIAQVDTLNQADLVSVDLFDLDNYELLITANCWDSSVSVYQVTKKTIAYLYSIKVQTFIKNYIHGVRFIPSSDQKIAVCVTDGDKGIHFLSLQSKRRRGHFKKDGWGVKDMSMLDTVPRTFIAVMTKNNVGQDHTIEHSIQLVMVRANWSLRRFKILSTHDLPGKAIEGILIRDGILYAASQGTDSVLIFDLRDNRIVQINELLGFSFPHGLDISKDGKFIAVSNYGTSSIVVRELNLSG